MKLLKGCYLLLAILGFSWAYGDTNTANDDSTCLPTCMAKCVGDDCYSTCRDKCLFDKKIDTGKSDTGKSDTGKSDTKNTTNDDSTCVIICVSQCTGPKDKCIPKCTENCFIDSISDKSKTNPFTTCDQNENVYECMGKSCQGEKDTKQCRYTCCTSSYSGSKRKTCCGSGIDPTWAYGDTKNADDDSACIPTCMSTCVGENCYSTCRDECLLKKKEDTKNDGEGCTINCMSHCTGTRDHCYPACLEECYIDSIRSKTHPFRTCDQSKNVNQCINKSCQGEKDTEQCRYTCCTSSYSGSKGKTCCGSGE